ncbi:acyl-[acyl-carrier-protein] thioesterase [Neolewinella agarilytica]|uniref:acyl-[acyl-carrier-protein] thioesterase n=1 Tax=Neolewinella agarilytica TaxID=478744 RepID=UPI0023573052|nr:acyl-ACP thioesterase domain-containing protein [Neolewinella agarilytica]
MITDSVLHEKVEFSIPAFAVGPSGRLTPAYLIRLLQEAAMINTVRLKISSPELMAEMGLSWVLRRQRINITRLPAMGTRVIVITAPSGFERRLQTFRDFHVLDEEGNMLLTAATQWLLMDVTSRRLKPIPPHIAALEADLAPAAAHLDRPLGKIKPPEAGGQTREFTVAYHQLDFNDHLTNPVFPELMLEPLGGHFLKRHTPTLLEVDYRLEARFGDPLVAQASALTSNGLLQRHALRREGDLLATMESHWRVN